MIAKITRGGGFGGAVNYAMNQGKNAIEGKEAELIGGNMTGDTAKELATEFKSCRKLRPEVAKPVWMEALRPAEGEALTKEQWNKLADDHMRAIGLNPDKHMHTITLHPKDNHIHIVASRIAIDGSLYLGRNEHLIASKDCRRIEKEYGLQQLPEKPTQDKKHLTKNEIEMKRITNEVPPREKLQGIIDKSLADRPTPAIFEKRLVEEGVSLKKTGNGYSYAIDNVPFKGSQLGKTYSYAALQKRFGIEIDKKPVAQEQVVKPSPVSPIKPVVPVVPAQREARPLPPETKTTLPSERLEVKKSNLSLSGELPEGLILDLSLAVKPVASEPAVEAVAAKPVAVEPVVEAVAVEPAVEAVRVVAVERAVEAVKVVEPVVEAIPLWRQDPTAHKWGVDAYEEARKAVIEHNFDKPYNIETDRLKVILVEKRQEQQTAREALDGVSSKFWKMESTQLKVEKAYKEAKAATFKAESVYNNRSRDIGETRKQWANEHHPEIVEMAKSIMTPEARAAKDTYSQINAAIGTHDREEKKIERERKQALEPEIGRGRSR